VNTIAYAAEKVGSKGGSSDLINMFLPLIIIFFIFWLLLIRPQQKRVKKHQDFISTLKRGDDVVTSSGIFGKITGIADNAITLEISDGVRIKVEKAHISGYAVSSQSTSTKSIGNTGK